MKARQVLIFFLSVFALMGMLWLAVPADGVPLGPVTLRFASYERALRDASERKVDVDSVLTGVANRFKMKDDTLQFYRRFFYENPDRIYLPGNDYRYFDGVFREMEKARADGKTVRVVHYGDSQIELDRISQDLREALQNKFGGSGTGFFPAVGNVPSASIYKSASGAFVQYTMYGDSTTVRAGHNRYGMLAQVVQLTGGGTITLRGTRNKNAREGVKTFTTVSVLYGRSSQDFNVKAVSDTLKPDAVKTVGESGTTLLTWTFSRPVQKATLRISGSAEIYAVGADGDAGVAVDNVPLRGCSGTIFHRISQPLMEDSFALTDTRLIILQFGGNYMPVARNTQVIEQYQEQIAREIQYFHKVAPQAKILFIGPSDMGKSVNGRIVTWPNLPTLVDSLKSTALRNDAAYWDLFRMMGGENSMAQWVKHRPAYAGPDYIHFTADGARKVGETLSQSFLTCYNFYQLRKTYPKRKVEEAMHP
jgi:lysophospholipase L1-like esterase